MKDYNLINSILPKLLSGDINKKECKDLIPRDYSRCGNIKCEKRINCKRFLQLEKDLKHESFGTVSVTNFKETDCENFIDIES